MDETEGKARKVVIETAGRAKSMPRLLAWLGLGLGLGIGLG